VTVAAHDLAAGVVLAADDVRTARLPAAVVPAGPVADPVGATLAAPLRRGEVLTDVRLVGQPSAQPPPGLVAAPVRLPDEAAAALLRPGDRIDLLATDARRGRSWTVAEDTLVLSVPAAAESGAGPLGGRVVVLAVPASGVEKVAAASVAEFITWVYSD
jgi:Flp pilus assembly protein CpaB